MFFHFPLFSLQMAQLETEVILENVQAAIVHTNAFQQEDAMYVVLYLDLQKVVI